MFKAEGKCLTGHIYHTNTLHYPMNTDIIGMSTVSSKVVTLYCTGWGDCYNGGIGCLTKRTGYLYMYYDHRNVISGEQQTFKVMNNKGT